MTTHKVITLLQVPGQNKRERWHWRRQRQEVIGWMYVFQAAGIPKATGKRNVVITSYRKRRFDDHANLVGGCKGLIDGLVRAGALVDDSIKWMTAEYHQDLTHAGPAGTGKACTVVEVSDAV
jgi:hypothetical protein